MVGLTIDAISVGQKIRMKSMKELDQLISIHGIYGLRYAFFEKFQNKEMTIAEISRILARPLYPNIKCEECILGFCIPLYFFSSSTIEVIKLL